MARPLFRKEALESALGEVSIGHSVEVAPRVNDMDRPHSGRHARHAYCALDCRFFLHRLAPAAAGEVLADKVDHEHRFDIAARP